MGKVVFQPPSLVLWRHDQTAPMPTLSVHESVGCPTSEAPVRPVSVRMISEPAPASDAASVAGAAAMPCPGPQCAGDRAGDAAASPASLAGVDHAADTHAARIAARLSRHGGDRRDLRGRSVAQSPQPASGSHQPTGPGHDPQDPRLRDSLPRRPGLGASRPQRESGDAVAVDPSTSPRGHDRLVRYLHQLYRHRLEGLRPSAGAAQPGLLRPGGTAHQWPGRLLGLLQAPLGRQRWHPARATAALSGRVRLALQPSATLHRPTDDTAHALAPATQSESRWLKYDFTLRYCQWLHEPRTHASPT